jgi:hypothetical protein
MMDIRDDFEVAYISWLKIKPMDFVSELGAKRSDTGSIARLCNDALAQKTRFDEPRYVRNFKL